MQQQKSKIAEQAELIEKLNGSDLILSENERLKKLNSELEQREKHARHEAEVKVSAVKREYAEKERELAHTQYEADSARSEAEALKKRQNELIKDEAKKMYHSKEKSLKSAYKAKETALEGAFFGSLAYGVLVTVLTAIRSKVFLSDFEGFFVAIWGFITTFGDFALKTANWASQFPLISRICSRVYGSVKGKSLREERSQIIKAVSLDNRREQKKEKSKENGVVMRFS